MSKFLTEKDIEDGKKISVIFAELSEENKTIANAYLSALRDKELAELSNTSQNVIKGK